MKKDECRKELLSGNNTLNSIIIRIDFLTIEVDKIVEEILVTLGDKYVYNKIDNYDIDFDISEPKKLITQDFIKQKVNLKNNYEFKSVEDDLRFVINQNFFLYERKNFTMYEGSKKDTEIYMNLLKIIFESNPKIQRLGVRKSNMIFIEQQVQKLKSITDNTFIKSLDENINQKFNLIYTPLEENQKDGYNLNIQLDYGKLNINAEDKDVYRFILDIDSYIRDIEKINEYEKIQAEVDRLKNNDFEIYKKEMSEEFLDAIVQNDEQNFRDETQKMGILFGANYGKH